MEPQITASVFVIDENKDKFLLMYNKKLEKWLQPGGHLENNELLHECAIRECFTETGIEIEIINFNNDEVPIPIATKTFETKIGDMIDYQYYGKPKSSNVDLKNNEGNRTGWFTYNEMVEMGVEEYILEMFKSLYNLLKRIKLASNDIGLVYAKDSVK